jgi:hypothetical protein
VRSRIILQPSPPASFEQRWQDLEEAAHDYRKAAHDCMQRGLVNTATTYALLAEYTAPELAVPIDVDDEADARADYIYDEQRDWDYVHR